MAYSYRTLREALATLGVDDPAEEAFLLLSHTEGLSRAAILSDRHRLYDSPTLHDALRRRAEHEPIQYIIGEWSFYGCRFAVSPACLIPRPDTEILVETACRLLPKHTRFLDLCTGSGCVAVATLVNRPDLTADALELFFETLAIAEKNAAVNAVRDRFTPVCADLLAGGDNALRALHAPACGGLYSAILSNPPYIPSRIIPTLSPEVAHEPHAALDGGEDGLTFYRAILRDYASLVTPGGLILLEIGYDQGEALCSLSHSLLPSAEVQVLPDLAGHDRVVVIRL